MKRYVSDDFDERLTVEKVGKKTARVVIRHLAWDRISEHRWSRHYLGVYLRAGEFRFLEHV